ncbi:nucleolar zinc-finger protein [Tulasnella sp. 419]|nr:nucleolar zinc-finger protein [Tulasnella sp. 418]KAG8966381.1 nucleolar zinc-finger protein [Tulasnella sp. 419]
MSTTTSKDPFFKPIGSLAEEAEKLQDKGSTVEKKEEEEEEERPVQEIESLCMSCGEQGMTRLMLTSIPYFREVIVMSFRCEHCGTTNNEIQSAGEIREQGCLYTAKIVDRSTDFNRQIVKSATCTISIPELELTIPAHRGQLTTVEGMIRDTVSDLQGDQPLRKIMQPDVYEKIEALIGKLKLILGEKDGDDEKEVSDEEKAARHLPPFTIKLDDPAGNSWIEFLGTMAADTKWTMKLYNRTKEQNIELGLIPKDELEDQEPRRDAAQEPDTEKEDIAPNEEIYVFPGICSSCSAPLNTMMKKVVIPYFKDILIMSTNCEKCGYRDNEVKSGAAISEKGKRITLKVEDSEDLARDILKSETCGLTIPEIDLVLQPGTLGGRFTTLEGILNQVYEELSEKAFARGDAAEATDARKDFETFLAKLKRVMTASTPFTIILDDPLANSYLQNIYAPDPDPNMETVVYERSWEQNEELGLNDMKVENYENTEGKTDAQTETKVQSS